jgi:hypothetical protein
MTDFQRPGPDYVIAHEGRDSDLGCPLYQHLCGHVESLSQMESIGIEAAGSLQQQTPPTGRACPHCGQDPQPSAWRLLWRRRSPADKADV